MFARLSTRISDLEKKEAATAAALPLMFELNKVNAERYTDACCCKSETNLLMTANGFVVNILNKPVRFGEDDVNQLVEIFKTFKQNN